MPPTQLHGGLPVFLAFAVKFETSDMRMRCEITIYNPVSYWTKQTCQTRSSRCRKSVADQTNHGIKLAATTTICTRDISYAVLSKPSKPWSMVSSLAICERSQSFTCVQTFGPQSQVSAPNFAFRALPPALPRRWPTHQTCAVSRELL